MLPLLPPLCHYAAMLLVFRHADMLLRARRDMMPRRYASRYFDAAPRHDDKRDARYGAALFFRALLTI